MGKGNMFQGMVRGKVGDVVFSRLNGQQISRVRNRNPKNPRTNAQLYQRAIMATVMQAYSAGKVIFDHSFQGKEVGAGNQRRFMSLNTKLLRGLIAADIDGAVATASQQGRVVAPGVPSPVPATLQVSEGSLLNTLLPDGTLTASAGADETVAQYCARLGLNEQDLFTFVAFVIYDGASVLFTLAGDDTNYSKQYASQFIYARYQVKASALSSTTLMSAANLGNILELTESNFAPFPLEAVPGDPIDITFLTGAVDVTGSFAWIRSRFDEGLRSSENMVLQTPNTFGIASEFALAAWKQGTARVGDSDLILEGGDI